MISRCVCSVAKLPLPHEHLIQDGASTDGTLGVLSELQCSNQFVSVVSEPDRGVYDAFNKAVRRAKGKWVYFLGSDDYVFDVTALADVVGQAERSGIEFVISLVRNSDGSCWFSGPRDFSNILIIKPYGHQGVLMTRDLIVRLGLFDVDYRIASDFKLCLSAHLANVSHLYVPMAFAEFSVGKGISTLDSDERQERLQMSAELLGVAEQERTLLYERQLLPWSVILRCLFHANAVIRQGGRHAVARRLANTVGFLDETGGPKGIRKWLQG